MCTDGDGQHMEPTTSPKERRISTSRLREKGSCLSRTALRHGKLWPASPLFGGGMDNIAFLLGDPAALVNPNPPGQNAQSVEMTATFWIEQLGYTILVPPFKLGAFLSFVGFRLQTRSRSRYRLCDLVSPALQEKYCEI